MTPWCSCEVGYDAALANLKVVEAEGVVRHVLTDEALGETEVSTAAIYLDVVLEAACVVSVCGA